MSLINDALKRAKQAHTENPTPPPDLPFRAAEPSQNRTSGFPLLPVAALVIVLVLGGGLIFLALQTREAAPQVVHAAQSVTSPMPSPAVETPSTETPGGPISIAPASTTPPTTPATPQAAVASPATDSPAGSTAGTPVVVTNLEPLKPALPKLQGIFYHPSRPSAVVNGRTAYVGSHVGEARDFLVLAISRESITVGNGSQTNVLALVD